MPTTSSSLSQNFSAGPSHSDRWLLASLSLMKYSPDYTGSLFLIRTLQTNLLVLACLQLRSIGSCRNWIFHHLLFFWVASSFLRPLSCQCDIGMALATGIRYKNWSFRYNFQPRHSRLPRKYYRDSEVTPRYFQQGLSKRESLLLSFQKLKK